MSVSSNEAKPLRKSQSMPHISSRNDSGFGYSGAGSCSLLDQIGCPNHFHQNIPHHHHHHLHHHHHHGHHHHHHHNHNHPDQDEKTPYSTRLVADLRQLMTLRQHYYPEGGWGWLLVVVACLVQSISHGLHMSISILILQIVTNFHQNIILAAMLGTISLGFSLIFSPVAISLCKRKSTRLIAVIGGLITALGLLFTSFASQIHQMMFSFGIMVGLGVGLTRDCSTIMVAQYFKKKREFVEIFVVSGSGCGMIFISIFYKKAIDSFGWRLGLQAITCTVFSTFILGLFYRSASLYHPQRRAILHLKNQRRKVKDKNKQSNGPPFFDFKTLKSKTVQIILLSTSVTAFGLYSPIFYLANNMRLDGIMDRMLLLQSYMGSAWIFGCLIYGFLVVRNSVECRIARQYLCQVSGFMCGLCMLALIGLGNNFEGYAMFVWIFGIFCGGYHYSLKVYTYERVRARNFARAWSFVQCSQSIPICIGIPLVGYLNENVSPKLGYIFSAFCTIIGSLLLFLVDVHKKNITRHKHTRSNGTRHLCVSDECPQNRKLSFTQEPENEPVMNFNGTAGGLAGGNTAIIINSELLVKEISDELVEPNKSGIDKPELTCISEEGIADMDLPDNLFDDFDYIGDCITSCNKVENYLMLSEFEQNLNVEMPHSMDSKSKKCQLYSNVTSSMPPPPQPIVSVSANTTSIACVSNNCKDNVRKSILNLKNSTGNFGKQF